MKEIPLSQGLFALIDDEDFNLISGYKWCAAKSRNTFYAVHTVTGENRHELRMHRVILDAPPQFEVDHRNGNGLDNRRSNLRLATRAQNRTNSGISKRNKSGFKGVTWDGTRKHWRADIRRNGHLKYLGKFENPRLAAIAYDEAAIRFHGEFANLNFP